MPQEEHSEAAWSLQCSRIRKFESMRRFNIKLREGQSLWLVIKVYIYMSYMNGSDCRS